MSRISLKAALGVICAMAVGMVVLLSAGSRLGVERPKAEHLEEVYTPSVGHGKEFSNRESDVSKAEPQQHRPPDGQSNADANAWAWPSGAIAEVDSFLATNLNLVVAASRDGDRAAARLLGRLFAACFGDGRNLQSCNSVRAAAAPGEKTQWVSEAASASDRLAQIYYHDIAMGELREDDPAYGRRLDEINQASVRYLESAAAVGGDGVAMLKLSFFYRSGIQVPRSVEKAYLYGLAGSWTVPHRRSMSAEKIEHHDSGLAQLRKEIVDQERVPELQRLAYAMRG